MTINAQGRLDDHDGGWVVERFTGSPTDTCVGVRVAQRLGVR